MSDFEQCSNRLQLDLILILINFSCRWCKDNMETQEHILKQCAEFKHITQNITYFETYFDDDTNMTKIAAETIHNVITKLSELD